MEPNWDFIFHRRHPHYFRNLECWQRSAAAYAGGEAYLRQALIRHVSEVELEFAERLRRAYYFNYPRKLARLITQFVLSVEPTREGADPELVEDFSRSGLRTGEVMRQFSTLLNVFGGAAIEIEMPFFEGEVDCERREREKLRPAAKVHSPLEVPDWGFGADGELDWIIFEERVRVAPGPWKPAVELLRRKLYTREECFVLEREAGTGIVRQRLHAAHRLGAVPAFYLVEPDGYGLNSGHYFEDVVRISDAILNNESESQMNIVKQMFGLLVISEGFARGARSSGGGRSGGATAEKFSHVLARSAAIWESPEERGISRYISPSGADTGRIREENDALKRELFDTVGMALVTPCREAQTAESKAWDYHQVKQFLACRADMLEQAELRCWRLMAKFDPSIRIPSVLYNREFAVADLKSSIESLLELREFSGGETYRREVEKSALFLLEKIRKIDPEHRRAIFAEIERGDGEVRHD